MHKTQKKLLAAIKKNPESSIRDLQAACYIKNVSVADYHLMKLTAAGEIRKILARWEIVEKE
jgi:predicted transcriptional regulator